MDIKNHTNDKLIYKNVPSLYGNRSYDLVRVGNSNHIVTSPCPTDTELKEIYKNDYAYDVHLLIRKEKTFRAKHLVRRIKPLLLGKKHFLELGCMFGDMIVEINKMGIKTTGIELNSDAANLCFENNLNVKNMDGMEFLKSEKNKFDVVFMSHSLEHFINPEHTLQLISNVIKSGGLFIAVVPNNQSFLAKIFGRFWGYWALPVHINHFSKDSLSNLVEKNGFIVKNTLTAGGDSLMWIASIMNMLSFRQSNNTSSKVSVIQKVILKVFSTVFKYWYLIGNDDLILIAQKE